MVSRDALPEALLSPCLDILRTLSASERDLIRIIVEVVHELRDNDNEEDDDAMVRLYPSSLFSRKSNDECGREGRASIVTLGSRIHQCLRGHRHVRQSLLWR